MTYESHPFSYREGATSFVDRSTHSGALMFKFYTMLVWSACIIQKSHKVSVSSLLKGQEPLPSSLYDGSPTNTFSNYNIKILSVLLGELRCYILSGFFIWSHLTQAMLMHFYFCGEISHVKPDLYALCFTPSFVFGSIHITRGQSSPISLVLVGSFVWCCGHGHWACPPWLCSSYQPQLPNQCTCFLVVYFSLGPYVVHIDIPLNPYPILSHPFILFSRYFSCVLTWFWGLVRQHWSLRAMTLCTSVVRPACAARRLLSATPFLPLSLATGTVAVHPLSHPLLPSSSSSPPLLPPPTFSTALICPFSPFIFWFVACRIGD